MAAAAIAARPVVSPDSALFATALEQYRRHSPAPFAGRCAACQARDCPVQRHAVEIIAAGGAGQTSYDPPSRRPTALTWLAEPTQQPPALAERS